MNPLEYKNNIIQNIDKAKKDIAKINEDMNNLISMSELKLENNHIDKDRFKSGVHLVCTNAIEQQILRLNNLLGKLKEMKEI